VNDSGHVVAFWSQDPRTGGWSRGTADSIRKAMLKGNLRVVRGPGGEPLGWDVVGELLRQTLGS
jgi:hypothetical protein